MAVVGINTKCFILALFIRDDNERFLLGDGYYEFKNDLKHFQANTIVNDVVEVQGNDGYLLAGQVRRSGTQEFNGYIADGTVSKTTTEDHRRQFFSFFRKNHFYKVVYIMPDGSAIQRKRGFLVDDPTVSEMYQQYPEYHVALNFEDINYYVYNEDSEGHEIYGKSAVIGLIQGLSGGLIWDALGAVSDVLTWVNPVNVSGANIAIDNQLGAMVPIEDLELKGDTSQASSPTPDAPQAINVVTGEQTVSVTTNKNMQPLFANGSISSAQTMTAGHLTVTQFYSSYGQTLTVQDGEISTTSTNTSMWKMIFSNLEPSTQYTISANFDVTLSGTDKRFFALGNYRHTQPDHVTDRFSKTITTDATGRWESSSSTTDTLFYLYNNSGVVVSDIQLEKGSATTYAAYLGRNSIVNLGKNLLDFSTMQQGSFNYVTNADTTDNNRIRSVYISCTPDTKYTISANTTLGEVGVVYLAGDGTTISGSGGTVNATSYTFTSKTNAHSMRIRVGNSTSPFTTSGSYDLMLEKNDRATSYTPYFAPIELAKIGTYQDYIYKSGDDWYVHKATEKMTLDGTENWSSGGSGTQVRFFITLNDIALQDYNWNASIVTVSNAFVGTNWFQFYNTAIDNAMCSHDSSHYLMVRATQFNDTTAFKTWLQSNNVTVYYALATPTDTQITDATLISQLEALGAMRLYIGENNLSVSSASLPAILDFDYYSGIDYSGAGYEWEDGGTGGPETITVDSIDNVYPVWTVTGPALNPQLSVLTTNTTTTYAGTVAVGQTLVIDMFNKTATLNGTSVIGNVAGDWANFKPGNNRVIYSTNNADAPASKIEWQEVVG